MECGRFDGVIANEPDANESGQSQGAGEWIPPMFCCFVVVQVCIRLDTRKSEKEGDQGISKFVTMLQLMIATLSTIWHTNKYPAG